MASYCLILRKKSKQDPTDSHNDWFSFKDSADVGVYINYTAGDSGSLDFGHKATNEVGVLFFGNIIGA